MSLDHLLSKTYGPRTCRVVPEKIAEYVAATGDDPDRWRGAAPPSFAGLLLFVVASEFVSAPDVIEHTRVLLHTDQVFRWHQPLTVGQKVQVTGRVERVRHRGAVSLVTFSTAVTVEDGSPLIEATSKFVMGSEPAQETIEEWPEPPVNDRARTDPPVPAPLPAVGGALPQLAKSASRADLVRYAGASGDFNPIHLDHRAAVAAGLPGVVAHGLLLAAWVTQAASAATAREDPLVDLRLRFRAPLRPGAPALVSADVETIEADTATLQVAVRCDGARLVTGRATARTR